MSMPASTRRPYRHRGWRPGRGVQCNLDDTYRHVTVRGRFLNADEAQVYTLSALGAGYWIMTPLRTDEGAIVYINRGFVPMDQKAPVNRPAGQTSDEVSVTGLLRLPETKGYRYSRRPTIRRTTPGIVATSPLSRKAASWVRSLHISSMPMPRPIRAAGRAAV